MKQFVQTLHTEAVEVFGAVVVALVITLAHMVMENNIKILASSTTPKNKLTVQNPKTQQTIESSYHPR
jgi:hypothetical protein